MQPDRLVLSLSCAARSPIWGLLGMGDLAVTQEIGYESPTNIIVPALFFFFLLLATVVLVNLLIAQVTVLAQHS